MQLPLLTGRHAARTPHDALSRVGQRCRAAAAPPRRRVRDTREAKLAAARARHTGDRIEIALDARYLAATTRLLACLGVIVARQAHAKAARLLGSGLGFTYRGSGLGSGLVRVRLRVRVMLRVRVRRVCSSRMAYYYYHHHHHYYYHHYYYHHYYYYLLRVQLI